MQASKKMNSTALGAIGWSLALRTMPAQSRNGSFLFGFSTLSRMLCSTQKYQEIRKLLQGVGVSKLNPIHTFGLMLGRPKGNSLDLNGLEAFGDFDLGSGLSRVPELFF